MPLLSVNHFARSYVIACSPYMEIRKWRLGQETKACEQEQERTLVKNLELLRASKRLTQVPSLLCFCLTGKNTTVTPAEGV